MEARNAEKKAVTKVLRSLVISSPTQGKSLNALCQDYYEYEGKKIPTFEYRRVEDFLRATHEFIIENYRGELIIYVVTSPRSYHISKLVAEQGRPKRRTIATRARPPHPLQPRPAYFTNTVSSPAKTIVPVRKPTQVIKYSFEQLKMQQHTANNSVQNRLAINLTNQKTPINNNCNSKNNQNKTTQPIESKDLRNRLNELRQTKFVDLTIEDSQQTNHNVKPISPNIAPSRYTAQPSSLHSQQEKAPIFAPPNVAKPLLPSNPFLEDCNTTQQSQIRNPQSYSAHTSTSNPSVINDVSVTDKKRRSVNDRLDKARLSTPPTTPDLPNTNVNTTSPTSTHIHLCQLIDFCKINKLSEPKFKTFRLKNGYHCYVLIDNIRYSEYPVNYGDQEEAISETAKHALERLFQIKNQQKYEVCYDNEMDLIIKIYDCIKDSPTGVLSRYIPGKFREQYQQLLPSHWMTLLAKYPKYFTIDDSVDDQIVFVVESTELDHRMDKLQLPWDEEYWGLFISHTVSTSEIYGRLVGDHHSHALDALITDIELDLFKNKRTPEKLNIGQLYLVVKCECVYRVRIEKIDAAAKRCFCYYVDEGDRQWLDSDELYVCETKFMKFPPQAIRLSLYGLEDYNENDFAVTHLEAILLNRSPLFARIFTKKDDFISHEESPDLEPIVEVVLYDTTTAEDINLHPIIEDKICSDMPHPKLLPDLTPVLVSHISDKGDIFVQLQDNGLHYINKLFRKYTKPNTNSGQTVQATNIQSEKVYYVLDEELNEYCRAKFISETNAGNSLFLVDYGKTIVPLSKIYPLDTLSQALASFPPQAIQVKLSGFDDFPADLVSTLRGIFSGGAKAYVFVDKESVPGFIPKAKLYFVKDDCIINVHDCIKSDLDRYQTNEASLSRQSSITSNVGINVRASEDLPKVDNLARPTAPRFGTKLPKFEPPQINDYFDHLVVLVANPSNFKIRSIKYMPRWVEQMKKLQEYCKISRETLQWNMIRKGEAYACLYAADHTWQRAIIVELLSLSKIIVFYCDTGDVAEIDDVMKLKWLPEEFRTLPKLAVTAKLSGIKPINGDWEMHDIMWFKRLVTGNKYQAIVDKVTVDADNPDNNAVLEIRLIDVSTSIDICINDKFVTERRAKYSFTP